MYFAFPCPRCSAAHRLAEFTNRQLVLISDGVVAGVITHPEFDKIEFLRIIAAELTLRDRGSERGR